MVNLESLKEQGLRPSKLEVITNPNTRVVIAAVFSDELPHLEIKKTDYAGPVSDTGIIKFRLTANKARKLGEWLQKYAAWAEKQPSQGGK